MQKFDWDNISLIREIVESSTSRVDVLIKMGYSPQSSLIRRKLNAVMKEYNMSTESFVTRNDRWDQLPDIIKDCYSVAQVLKAVGLEDKGNNYKTAKEHISRLKLDTSHFGTDSSVKGNSETSLCFEDVFCEDSQVVRATLRNWIKRHDVLDYTKCHQCGISDWHGQQLTLDLDHINGISNDNRIENLRYLCPNCHSLTPTHRGKKRN